MTARPARHDASARSPFTGQYVHELLGLALSAHGPRPLFDDDRWDLRGAQGAPIQVNPGELDWDFTEIPRPYWRLLVREFVVALRAPHHERITRLPWARREPLSLRTCAQRRFFAVAWLRWLAGNGVQYLEEVTQEHCDRWLHQRRGEDAAASSMSNAVTAIKDLARYTELFTADRYPAGFMPWAGKTATQVAEADRAGENKTPPVPDSVMRPALRAGLYLAETIGPHAASLAEELAAHRQSRTKRTTRCDEYTGLMARYAGQGEPLPELDGHFVRGRLKAGWDPDDPLLRVGFRELAHDLGAEQFPAEGIRECREAAESAVALVGVAPRWGRRAPLVQRADDAGQVPWTMPLTTQQIDDLTLTVFNAALFAAAALTGMRSSELMELTSDSCLPPEEVTPGLFRYRLASQLIKGQPWGGTADEWVVIEPAYRAVELAIRLTRAKTWLAAPQARESLFGRCNLGKRFRALRKWVNSPEGTRLGLEPIPDGNITGRMARRTLSLELAHRPHGLWAAKVHLKQVSVSTTEGYAARPGGAQGRLHAEMKREEQAHKLALTKAAYQAYRDGRMPAGPAPGP